MVQSKPAKKGAAAKKDFDKVKGKVGKAKAGSVNATDTSFQSRRLALKEQQLSTQQKVSTFAQSADVSEHSLHAQIHPHLSQLNHYNIAMRKDAFNQTIKKCKEASTDQLESVLAVLLESASKAVVDEDSTVRTLLASLMTLLFERLNPSTLAPLIVKLWVPYLVLAFTHIKEEVRRDACKFLQLSIDAKGDLMLPSMVKVIVSMAAAPPLKSIQRGKAGKVKSAKELGMTLIESFTAKKNDSSTSTSTSSLQYTWQEQQTQSLRVLRVNPASAISSTTATILPEVNSSDLQRICRWLNEGLVDDWLEAQQLIKSGGTIGGEEAKEAHQRLITHLQKLMSFATASNNDPDWVLGTVPSAITKNSLWNRFVVYSFNK